jgi:hypothetical protein
VLFDGPQSVQEIEELVTEILGHDRQSVVQSYVDFRESTASSLVWQSEENKRGMDSMVPRTARKERHRMAFWPHKKMGKLCDCDHHSLKGDKIVAFANLPRGPEV